MVHPERFRAFPIADVTAEDVLHPGRHLPLETFALYLGGVGLARVLKGRVDPILNWLDEPGAQAYTHCTTGQPLRLQLL
jgi:hypothetical protein